MYKRDVLGILVRLYHSDCIEFIRANFRGKASDWSSRYFLISGAPMGFGVEKNNHDLISRRSKTCRVLLTR